MSETDFMTDQQIDEAVARLLKGKKVAITAGPTQEKIDPVRFISNYSTGKMGFALAEAFAAAGAKVTLITGPVNLPTPPGNITRIDVVSACEMLEAASEPFAKANIGVFSAAVADYRPAVVEDHKIKREGVSEIELKLEANPDIAATLGKDKGPKQVFIGFALETDNEIENARKKLYSKNLDAVVLNSMRDAGAGFGTDTNKITIVEKYGERVYPLKSKREVADDIVSAAADILFRKKMS